MNFQPKAKYLVVFMLFFGTLKAQTIFVGIFGFAALGEEAGPRNND